MEVPSQRMKKLRLILGDLSQGAKYPRTVATRPTLFIRYPKQPKYSKNLKYPKFP